MGPLPRALLLACLCLLIARSSQGAPVKNAVGTPIVVHFHTKFSDGEKTPQEVAWGVGRDGARGVIITDHHYCHKSFLLSVRRRDERFSEIGTSAKEINGLVRYPGEQYVGYPNYLALERQLSTSRFTFISGVELSCFSPQGQEQHLLLLDISGDDEERRRLRSMFVQGEDEGESGLARGIEINTDQQVRKILASAHALRIPTVAAHPASPANPYLFGMPLRSMDVNPDLTPRLIEFFNNGVVDRPGEQPTSRFDRASAERAELSRYLSALRRGLDVGVTAGSDFHTDGLNGLIQKSGGTDQWHRYTYLLGVGEAPSKRHILDALFDGCTYAAVEDAALLEVSPQPGFGETESSHVRIHATLRGSARVRAGASDRRALSGQRPGEAVRFCTTVRLYRSDRSSPVKEWEWPLDDETFALDYVDTDVADGQTYSYFIYAPHQLITSPIRLRVASSKTFAGPRTTVFVVDHSGSMEWPTPEGKQKLQAAKEAASGALRLIRFDVERLGADHHVGVVGFSSQASGILSPTSNVDEAESAIQSLRPGGATNFGDALDTAIAWFERLPTERERGRKILIFLSDGCTNQGPVSRDDFLHGDADTLPLYQRLRAAGVRVFTVGFGEPGRRVAHFFSTEDDMDEDVLRAIADAPGTGGSYMHATNAARLNEVYLESVHAGTGTTFFRESGVIHSGETRKLGPIDPYGRRVTARRPGLGARTGSRLSWFIAPAHADGQTESQMLLTLDWDGGDLGIEIRDPSGRLLDESYPGASIDTTARPYCIAVDHPAPGGWTVTLAALSTPSEGSRFNVIASARVPPRASLFAGGAAPASSDDQLLFALLVAIAGLGLMCAIVAVRRRAAPVRRPPGRPTGRPGTARLYLHVQPRGGAARNIPLSEQGLYIGRAPGNQLVLADPKVSAHHALLRREGARVTMTDLGSTNGTWVNDRRVGEAALRVGDRVRIGNTELVLRSAAPPAGAGGCGPQQLGMNEWHPSA